VGFNLVHLWISRLHPNWPLVACVVAIARFCGNRSELEVAERWYRESALEGLLGVRWEQVYDNRLYCGLDTLIDHKEAICGHLLERYQSWLGVEFEFLLYDATSTYFEGQAEGNAKIDFLRERGASYLVGTPKGQLRRFEHALLEDGDWSEVRPGVEVKLVAHPDGRGGEQ